jgi:GT2 family glycosyltransferase
MPDRVTVVIATRNRRRELLRTLGRLDELPDCPPVIVVDNASADGSAAAVRGYFPAVTVRVLPRNTGAAARNTGVALAATPYVAFSDDDSWWEPGALSRAAAALDADPRLGLVAARTLVGPTRDPDPVNAAMAHSPLRDGGAAEVLGFLGCACVLRKEAFLRTGGFSELLFFIGEERLLSYDLAAAGWGRRYLPDVVAVHEPSAIRPTSRLRRRAERRNLLLTAWLRRPAAVVAAETLSLARDAARDPDARAALAGALARLPAALRSRRRLPADVERKVRLLAAAQGGSW